MKYYVSIACVITAFLAGWVVNGWRLQTEVAEKEARILKATREKEQQLMQEIENLQNTLWEQQHESEKYINQLKSDIANSRLRLSVPVRNCTNSAPTTGEARAELDGKTANDLVSIADDGDRAIRELNYCIDAYNSLKK